MSTTRSGAVAAAYVPITFVLVNAFSYALLLVAAHLLSEADYGALSSLLGVLLISTIPMLALQTVAARRVATKTGAAGLVRATAVIGGTATLSLLLAAPAIAAFLHLSGLLGVLLVAATVPAGAVLGTAMGVAQGRRDFPRLAAMMAAATGGRSISGLIGLLLGRSTNATLAGIALGLTASAVVVGLAGRGVAAHRVSLLDRRRAGVVPETLNAALAHGTFLLLTSLDVLLARHVLPSSAAGVYAVGSVVTRAAVWLPQSIVALMFASLAEERHRRSARRASVVVFGLGAAMVAVTAVAGPLVVTVVGGAKYHELDRTMWLYALLGSSLAVLQLSVLAGLAQRTARRVVLLWVTVVADVVLVLATREDATPTRLVVVLVSVAGAAAAAGLWLTVRTPRAAIAPPPSAAPGPLP